MAIHPFRNLGLKCLSVAIAVLLWLTLAGQQTVERGLRIPLEIQNMPEGLQLLEEPPEFVDVRVRGASGTLARLGPGDVVAVVDAVAARPGRRLLNLTAEQVRVPFGVEVSYVSPPTIPFSFEETGSRDVPVVPSVEGEPAPGFIVSRVTVEPVRVTVVGPLSRIDQVKAAITEPVAIDDAQTDQQETVTVGVLDPAVRLTTPVVARVHVEILPSPVEETLRNVPVRMRGSGGGLSVRARPAVVTVVVRGSERALEELRVDGVSAFVDVSGLGPGRYDLPVQIEPVRTFGVARIDPALVQVQIR